MAKTVDPEATFLHDYRARTILEAVLWHGGEAEASKQAVLQFGAVEREALFQFLGDLQCCAAARSIAIAKAMALT